MESVNCSAFTRITCFPRDHNNSVNAKIYFFHRNSLFLRRVAKIAASFKDSSTAPENPIVPAGAICARETETSIFFFPFA
jgi:hypothetical protein